MAYLTTRYIVGIFANMDARLIHRRKHTFPDGTIIETVVWLLPAPVPGSGHRFKYRFYFGTPGSRLIGYDNERGKGDHRHYGEAEESYRFVSPDRLIADFWKDVDKWRSARKNDDDRHRNR